MGLLTFSCPILSTAIFLCIVKRETKEHKNPSVVFKMATNKNKLTSILMAFFLVFRLLLETLFISADPRPETFSGNSESSESSSKESRSSDGDEKKEEEHFNNNSDNDAALEASFKYFEIDNPEETTREAVKKKFRRLSRVHHPDRNNQSEESVKEMQKINRFYELLEQEFDRREVKSGLYNNESVPEEPTEETTDQDPCDPGDPDEPGISEKERKRRRKVHKRRRQKARQREK